MLTDQKRIHAALRHYIARSDEQTQAQILPGWIRRDTVDSETAALKRQREQSGVEQPVVVPRKPKRRRTGPVDKLDSFQRQALSFLNQRQAQRAQENEHLERSVDRESVLGVIAAIRDGHAWNEDNAIGRLWAGAKDSITTTEAFKASTPVRRLAMLHGDAISSAHLGECKRKFTALLIHHECKQRNVAVGKKATETFEKLTGLPLTSATSMNQTACAWLKFVEVWGLGGLVLAGPGHRSA